MCGIFGITSERENILPLLLSSLKHLSYRGYDSTGIGILSPDLFVKKAPGDVAQISHGLEDKEALVGIGHTRWATHGQISVENAHPLVSGEVSVVHNGIIQNYTSLKEILVQEGYHFKSDTDTEVIAHLLNQALRTLSPLEALAVVQSKLQGRYAFIAMISSYPKQLFGLANALPLLIGKSEQGFSIASDLIALQHCELYTKAPQMPFSIQADACSPELHFQPTPKLALDHREDNYTLSEITSQHKIPQSLNESWENRQLSLPHPKHILFVGCGSSFHCAQVAQYWFAKSGIFSTLAVASELKDQTIPSNQDTLIIAISQSGETADTLLCMERVLKLPHLHSIAITNTPTSTLAELCQTIIPLQVGVEKGVASTKAVTSQLLNLFNISQHFLRKPTVLPLSLEKAISSLYGDQKIAVFARIISNYQHLICLGRHTLLPIAFECALKIKELSYIHAEGMPLGELKHGPLALIDQKVLCLVLGDANSPALQTGIHEITARNGEVLLIGQTDPKSHIPFLQIQDVGDFNPIVINVACQLLAYYTALALKRPIDKPRNLAKSVTVE